jgi:predicted short-subunit dehydrogenase-like oxidoreductase (DUF2520 family)
MSRSRRVVVVGAGRAGLGLARALHSAGVPVAGVVTRPGSRARLPRGSAPSVRRIHDLVEGASHADVVLLCVPDAAIAGCALQLLDTPLRGKVVLHTSGVSGASVLSPLRRRGAAVGSMHPLTVFPPPGRGAPDLRGTLFAVDGDAAAVRAAGSLARALGGVARRVPARRRAAYHLAAALAANGLVALMDAAVSLGAREAGLPPRLACTAMVRLARAALAALDADPPHRALTGPVARGDLATVRRHLEVMRTAGPGTSAIYRALSCRAVDLARGDGRLDARQAAALRALLGCAARSTGARRRRSV